jgi:polysaccharide biosynthesis protein PslJ
MTSTTRRVLDITQLALAFAVLSIGLLCGLAIATDSIATVIVSAVAVAVGVCLIMPVRLLPPLALVTALVLPYEVTKWPVALLPLVIWLMRSPPARRRRRAVLWGALGLGGWLFLAAAFATVESRSGVVWLVAALCSVVWPMVRGTELPDPPHFKRVFLSVTTALAGFAIVEKFVLHSNPIYGALYASGGDPIVQGHTYRATTLLGHPLINGAIFATAAVLAVDEALARNARRGSLLQVLVLLSGLGATVSRGSTAAAVLGIGLLILVRQGRTTSSVRKVAVSLAMLLAGVTFVGGLAARNGSGEGQRSTTVRAMLVTDTQLALRGHELLGVGPGVVENYRKRFGLLHFDSRSQTTPDIALESTYAELLVGLGIPGVTLFLLLIGGAVVSALRSELLVGAGCALLTYALALGTFKTEGHVQLLVVLGLLLSLTAVASATPPGRCAVSERS